MCSQIRVRIPGLASAIALAAVLLSGGRGYGQGEAPDPLAELAALGDAIADTGPEGGGSIRAKRDADPTLANRLKDPRNLEAKVEQIQIGGFPMVAVRMKVSKAAKEGPGKGVKKNASLVIVPKLKVEGGSVNMTDPETLINAGAFYLKRGDKVMVRLGAQRDKIWEADYLERK